MLLTQYPDKLVELIQSDKNFVLFKKMTSKYPQYVPGNEQVEKFFSLDSNYFAWLVRHKLKDTMPIAFSEQKEPVSVENPKFSIIIPVYNTKKEWLNKAVESVWHQSFRNFELIICNDASTSPETNNSLYQLKYRYSNQESSPIRIIENKINSGISESTNNAVAASRGEYIILLDHDDELYLDALSTMYEKIHQYPDANIFYSDEDRISNKGYKYWHNFKPGFSPTLLETHNYILHMLCIKKDIFQAIGGMRKKYDGTQDFDLLLRLMDMGEKFIHVPNILYSWRESETSMVGGSQKPEIFILGKKALNEHFHRIGESIQSISDHDEDEKGFYRVKFKLPDKVNVLIVSSDISYFRNTLIDIKDPYHLFFQEVPKGMSPPEAALTNKDNIDAVLFLNPEIRPFSWPLLLNELISYALRKTIGIAGGMVISDDNRVVFAGTSMMPWKEIKFDHKDSHPRDSLLIKRIKDTLSVSRLAMAVSHEKLQLLVDNNPPEKTIWDLELCLRAGKNDLRVIYNPIAVSAIKKGFTGEMEFPEHEARDLLIKYNVENDPFLNPNLISKSKSNSINFNLPPQLPPYEETEEPELSEEPGESAFPYHKWLRKIAPDPDLSARRIEKMELKPFFSFILPTYNSNMRFFKEQINCIINQTYKNFEVYISDDSSSDSELIDYLKELSEQDARVHVIFSKQNSGIAGNTNQALKLAKGDYFVLCDHDDRIEPFALELIAQYINENPEADVIYSDEDMIDDMNFRDSPRLQPDWNPDMFTSHMYCPHLMSFKASLSKKVGLMDSKMDGAQDFDYVLRLTEQAQHIGHVPHILYSWRISPGSVAMDASEKTYAYDAGIKALESAMERRGEQNIKVVKAFGTALGVYRVIRKVADKKLSHIIDGRSDNVLSAIKSIKQISPVPVDIIAVVEEENEKLLNLLTMEAENIAKCDSGMASAIEIITAPKGSNRSVMFNLGAKQAKSSHLFFSSHNLEIIDSDYPLAALEHTQREEIGAVGSRIIYPNGCYFHTGMILGVNDLSGYAHRNIFQGPGYWNFAQCIRNYSALSWELLAVNKKKMGRSEWF